jgi:transcriptional regulator with XRE-family HTH domain
MTGKPGERMKSFRQSIGWSKAEFARAVGCHPTYIRLIEEGRRELSGLEFAQRLEALSAEWSDGPIRVEEWVINPLPPPASRDRREAAR